MASFWKTTNRLILRKGQIKVVLSNLYLLKALNHHVLSLNFKNFYCLIFGLPYMVHTILGTLCVRAHFP